MCEENQTQVTQIFILGFQNVNKSLLFIVFLLTYLFIIVGNLLIILLVTIIDQLQTPMYFFLKHLSIADVLLTNIIVPMTMDLIFAEKSVLPLWVCKAQLYLYGIFGLVQCFLIALMSYDRFLAICLPLRYSSLMRPDHSLYLVIGLWVLSSVLTSCEFFFVIHLNLCGLNSIDHFYCDFGPVVNLATSDTSILMLEDFVISIFTFFFPIAFIIMTYICIFFTILKISSNIGKRKAFSTCSSHLITVCMYYGSLMTIYLAPSDENSSHINKYISLLYLVGTPLLNPIIYSLRNYEIKRAVQKMISHILHNWLKT
ncbi:olfactory receptor 10A7-like [Dendropsophus ebraccatus]|uniref:olfactory receptor 10A7-like n=1 Tax=Dendropsophus ebraccatus TaxID=150705 RepID=UPI0038321ECC